MKEKTKNRIAYIFGWLFTIFPYSLAIIYGFVYLTMGWGMIIEGHDNSWYFLPEIINPFMNLILCCLFLVVIISVVHIALKAQLEIEETIKRHVFLMFFLFVVALLLRLGFKGIYENILALLYLRSIKIVYN